VTSSGAGGGFSGGLPQPASAATAITITIDSVRCLARGFRWSLLNMEKGGWV
jgi:hypothetical protein